jgi:hypothetical protein
MSTPSPYEQAREMGADRSKRRNLLGYFSTGKRGCIALVFWVAASVLMCGGLFTECLPKGLLDHVDGESPTEDDRSAKRAQRKAKQVQRKAKAAARKAAKAAARKAAKASKRAKKAKRGKRKRR